MADWQELYPHVHAALADEYRSLPVDQVELVVQGALGDGVTLEAAEGFFDDVGKAFGQAAPVLQRALPGAASGAAAGAALGPWGALGGALIGGLSSALSSGGGPAPAPAAPTARPAAPAAPRPAAAAPGVVRPPLPAAALAPGPLAGVPTTAPAPPMATPPDAAGTGSGPGPVVGQLLTALSSPTVQQALSAMLLGSAGARSVQGAGGDELPVAGITNMLGSLAHQASAEWEAIVPSPEQVSFVEGYDFGTPEVRSAWMFEQLAPPEEAELAAPVADEAADEAADDAWLDELYDEFEAQLMSESELDVEWSTP
jgi:hypothetical protein